MTIKLIVADDHEVVRKGLASMLAGTDIKIVAEAADGAEAVKLTAKHNPDVVLLDVGLSASDAMDALEKIRKALPATSVVMWSISDNPTYVAQAVARGAADYIHKDASQKQLIATITAAATGKSPIATGELQRVAAMMSRSAAAIDDDVRLTPRESQVLRHVALGLSNKETAQALSISVETVKEHVQNILRKFAVTDRTQAAVWAVRRGLV